jgi:hypothetical protein
MEPPVGGSDGAAHLGFPLDVPPGRLGMQPSLAMTYSSESSNGWLGWGWDLQAPSIVVDTRFGVPRYDASRETETYVLNGAMLAPVAERLAPVPRQPERGFRRRVEGSFERIVRHGADPASYSWEVTDKDGTRWLYGTTSASRLSAPTGPASVFQWFLDAVVDTHGNTVAYRYAHDDLATA